MMTDVRFRCSAGKTFAVARADGEVFLCTNFMRPEHAPLGNLYQGLTLRETMHRCDQSFCICPQYRFDTKLHAKAKRPWGLTARQVHYDFWLHWYVTEECFLSCRYCEAGNRPFDKRSVQPIAVPALMRTLAESGRRFHLSFTGGGEPFAVPNITEACAALTREHYISFNSNLLGIKMEDFLPSVDPCRLLYIQGSVHLQELERTSNVDRFIRNVKALREVGVRVNLVAVGTPAVIPQVPRFRETFGAHGIEFTFAPFSGVYQGRRYPDGYSEAELDALGLSAAAASVHKVGSVSRLRRWLTPAR